jgi:iron complex outermembrane recepter protein
MFSRGDIDGGFGAVPREGLRPRLHPLPLRERRRHPDLDQFTQEVRLASNGGGMSTGSSASTTSTRSLTAETFSFVSLAPGNPQDGYAFQTQDAESYALFGSLDYRRRTTAGPQGRPALHHDEKDFSAERPDPTFQTPTAAPIRVSTDADLVTWDLSATYKASETSTSTAGSPPASARRRSRAASCSAPTSRAASTRHQLRLGGRHRGGSSSRPRSASRASSPTTAAAPQPGRLLVRGRRPAGHRRRRRVQHRHPAQRDTTEGYGLEADIQFAPSSDWLLTLGAATTPPRSTTRTWPSRPAAAAARCSTRSSAALALVDGNPCPTPRSGSSTASSTTADRSARGCSRTPRLGLPRREELLPLRVGGVPGRRLRVGLRLGYAFPDSEVRGRALQPQPLRRGDRPRRHRLQQPHRLHQRAAQGGGRIRRPEAGLVAFRPARDWRSGRPGASCRRDRRKP